MKMSHQSHLVYEPSFTCKNHQFIGTSETPQSTKLWDAVGTGQVCETYIDPGSSMVKSFTMQEREVDPGKCCVTNCDLEGLRFGECRP